MCVCVCYFLHKLHPHRERETERERERERWRSSILPTRLLCCSLVLATQPSLLYVLLLSLPLVIAVVLSPPSHYHTYPSTAMSPSLPISSEEREGERERELVQYFSPNNSFIGLKPKVALQVWRVTLMP